MTPVHDGTLIRSAAGFCCSVQPASYSYHHQLFLLFRTNEKLWGRLCSPPSRGKSSFQRPQSFEEDSAVLQGESRHFKDPKALRQTLQSSFKGKVVISKTPKLYNLHYRLVVLVFFPVLSLQPKWQHKGHLVYSQVCSSTELYLLGNSLITYRSTALTSLSCT